MIVLPLSLWSLSVEAWSPLQDEKGMTPVRPERKEERYFPFLRMVQAITYLLISARPPQSHHCHQLWKTKQKARGQAVLG